MGRLTEAIAAFNNEAPLDGEHFFYLDVNNEKARKSIIDGRKELRRKPEDPTFFELERE